MGRHRPKQPYPKSLDRLPVISEFLPLEKGQPQVRLWLEELRHQPPGRDGEDRAALIASTLRELQSGSARGVVYSPGLAGPIGFAIEDSVPGKGRNATLLYLKPDRRTREGWRWFLHGLRAPRESEGPLVISVSGLEGIPWPEEIRIFRELGFARFSRWEMKHFPAAEIPPRTSVPEVSLRPVVLSDERALGDLHERAYASGIDRFLFAEDPDPSRDAVLHLRRILTGEWGELLSTASWVAWQGTELVGAILVTNFGGGPLIIDVMVDPAHQRRGIGGQLLSESLKAIRASEKGIPRLNVTEENTGAFELYRKFGFVPTLGPMILWCDLKALGILAPVPVSLKLPTGHASTDTSLVPTPMAPGGGTTGPVGPGSKPN